MTCVLASYQLSVAIRKTWFWDCRLASLSLVAAGFNRLIHLEVVTFD